MADLNERDTKLIQWLLEAHVKEAELEADLTAHISLTQKDSYRKRLQAHLTETRRHKRSVEQRIRKLGGNPDSPSGGLGIPGVPGAVGELAGKAIAAVKGQVGGARAAVTEQSETHLRNAREELREEHVEIALYTTIEAFATEVGDKDTAKLAREILREEERMAKFLSTEIRRLVKDVVKAQIPRDQRAATSSRSTTSRRRASTGSATPRTRRSTGTRSTASTRSRSSANGSGGGSRTTRARSAASS